MRSSRPRSRLTRRGRGFGQSRDRKATQRGGNFIVGHERRLVFLRGDGFQLEENVG